MKLIETKEKHIIKVLSIYEHGRRSLKERGVNQWQDEGPDLETLLSDMENNFSYVLEDREEIVGTTAVIGGIDKTYLEIDGAWLNGEDYITVHRFAISQKQRGKGYGKKMFQEIEELAKSKGIKNIRVDTHKDNENMNGLLKSLGYIYCGIIRLENSDLRNAYQKELRKWNTK